jgi:hypothetical protein
MRAYFRGHRAAHADRNRDNDEIRAIRCRGIGFYDLIHETELGNTPARRSRAGSRDNGARGALRADGTRDRGANQTHSDQRETIEDRGAIHGRQSCGAIAAVVPVCRKRAGIGDEADGSADRITPSSP